MPRKTRIDSAEGMVEVMNAATRPLLPPETVPMDEDDMPFFLAIVDEFARSEWTKHQLELAAMLARTMRDLVEEQIALRAEGSISYTEKGTPVANPRKTIIQMHAGTIFSMRRSLSLHATGKTGVQNKDLGNQRQKMKEVEANMPYGNEDSDDLISHPNHG